LTAKAYEKVLDSNPVKIRPYEMVIGLYSGDEHGMPGDPQKQNWVQVEAAFKNAPERMIYWKDGKKVRLSEEEMQV